MPSDDIDSPPYPSEAVNPLLLYNHLRALRKWVEDARPEHNKAAGKAVIPAPKPLPDKAAYTGQPVPTMMGHFLFLRRLRESWDHLVRTHEYADEWNTKACVKKRVMLLQAAAVLLNNAFTPHEHREAMKAREMERLQQTFERLNQAMLDFMEPKKNDPQADLPAGL